MTNPAAFEKFLNFSTFLLNLLTLTSEELALVYDEPTLLSFSAAARRRDDRAYKALVATFPGGEAELLADHEESTYDRVLTDEIAKWGNVAVRVTAAIMVARRANYEACSRAMAL